MACFFVLASFYFNVILAAFSVILAKARIQYLRVPSSRGAQRRGDPETYHRKT